MKKAITLLLAGVFLILLCSCGVSKVGSTKDSNTVESTKDPNAIEITAENFDKYFNTSYYCNCSDIFDGKAVGVSGVFGQYGFDLGTGTSTLYFYKGIDTISVYVEGASSNYNYNDIVVTFKCSGTYKEIVGISSSSKIGDAKDFSVELTVECNIAGEGAANTEYTLPADHYTHSDLIDAHWEIVSVSGTVTPAK